MAKATFMEGGNESATGRSRLSDPVPIRLNGALAPGTVVAADSLAFERIYAAGLSTLYVVCKLTNANAGTHTLTIHPLMDGGVKPKDVLGKDDTTGTRSEINYSDGIAVLSTSAQEDSYTSKGEAWFDIEIDTDGAQAADIDYVEVHGI